MRLKVLTINVQNDEGDYARRVSLLSRGLRDISPDLVAFQEVVRTDQRDQLAELLESTDLHGTHQGEVMAYEPPRAESYGGSALATRWPHEVVEALDLRSSDAQDVPWCTLAATVALPELGELLFIATTTSWRPEAEAVRDARRSRSPT